MSIRLLFFRIANRKSAKFFIARCDIVWYSINVLLEYFHKIVIWPYYGILEERMGDEKKELRFRQGREVPTITERLASYVNSIKFESLPEDVIHETKKRFIDALGCALGAVEKPPLKKMQKLRKERVPSGKCGNGKATLWGTTLKLPIEYAVELNTFAVRYLDWNDTYFGAYPGHEPAHPSDNIPSIAAVCESSGLGGKDLILGIVLSYEVQCRLCDSVGLRSRKWDHVNHIIPAASSACARLLRYSTGRISNVIANSLIQGFQPRINRDADELSVWKGFAAAEAAFKAMRGLALADALDAPRDIYEGKSGFCDTVLGGKSFTLKPSDFGGIGNRFKIMEGYIKHHNAEFHAQVPVGLILSQRKSILEKIDRIKYIEFLVSEPTWKIIGQDSRREPPKSKETADHSLHYMVSAALIDGELTDRQYVSKKLRNPKILSMMKKVRVREVPEFTECYPEKLSTVLRVIFKDGRVIESKSDYPYGHYKNPMSDSELEKKFRGLASGSITKKQADGILKDIWDLEEINSIGGILKKMKTRR